MSLARYRDLFVSEAQEHLRQLASLSIRCDDSAAGLHHINEMFRHAHSLKGMAATMQLAPISTLAHAVEDMLSRLRDGKITATQDSTDLLLAAFDTLEQMVQIVGQGGEAPEADQLAGRIKSYSPAAADAGDAAVRNTPQTEDAFEFPFRNSDNQATTRVKTSLLDRLVTLSGELLTVRHSLQELAASQELPGLGRPLKELTGLLRQLQQEVFQARMLPFEVIAERYPRMVRDLATKTGKEVNFRIEGSAIEFDRGVLEQIVEPLVHLLRNAVDHGLETPAERVGCGKPSTGVLTLQVTRHADQIQLDISDDGRGMDADRIRAKAVARGMLTRERALELSDQEALLLICTPGFSTAATVTDISGRGVGMDVVQHAVKSIGGSLSISSEPGRGSTITLQLPISVAIIHAMLVVCGNLTLAVPVSALNGTLEVRSEQIIQRGRDLFLQHADTELPLRNLPQFFRQPSQPAESGWLPVLLTEFNRKPVGLLVDRVLGQQEIFTRKLKPPLSEVRGVSGSCLLGSGQVVFVIDPAACAATLTRRD